MDDPYVEFDVLYAGDEPAEAVLTIGLPAKDWYRFAALVPLLKILKYVTDFPLEGGDEAFSTLEKILENEGKKGRRRVRVKRYTRRNV